MKSILFSFAHPDDESFSGAGTAMKYRADGVRSVLVTATLGERGKAGDPPVCDPAELGACREQELKAAAAIIGFREVHLLRHRDRGLMDTPVDAIRQSLVRVIRDTRPVIVVTFDPNGFNLHPDHVAISRFTSDAITAASDPRWYPDAGEPHIVRRLLWTPLVAPWDVAGSCPLSDQPGADFVIDVSPWRERRVAALRAHRTQHLSIDKYFFGQPDPGRILDVEIWRQAWGPALSERPANDIFTGL